MTKTMWHYALALLFASPSTWWSGAYSAVSTEATRIVYSRQYGGPMALVVQGSRSKIVGLVGSRWEMQLLPGDVGVIYSADTKKCMKGSHLSFIDSAKVLAVQSNFNCGDWVKSDGGNLLGLHTIKWTRRTRDAAITEEVWTTNQLRVEPDMRVLCAALLRCIPPDGLVMKYAVTRRCFASPSRTYVQAVAVRNENVNLTEDEWKLPTGMKTCNDLYEVIAAPDANELWFQGRKFVSDDNKRHNP